MEKLPNWELEISGRDCARANMDADETFFAGFDPGKSRPRLRFYGWSEPCITVGYSVRDGGGLDKKLLKSGIEIVKRPTGGGCVFHDRDIAFSLVLPARFFGGLRDCYSRLGRIIIRGLEDSFDRIDGLRLADETVKAVRGWCFAGPDRYDVVCGNRKLCGLAQRRKRDKIMFQGSIFTSLWRPEDFFINPANCLFNPRRSIGLDEIAGCRLVPEKVIKAIVSGFSAEISVQFDTIR